MLGREGDQAGTLHERRESVRGPSIPETRTCLVTGGWLTRLGTQALRTLVCTVLTSPHRAVRAGDLGWRLLLSVPRGTGGRDQADPGSLPALDFRWRRDASRGDCLDQRPEPHFVLFLFPELLKILAVQLRHSAQPR